MKERYSEAALWGVALIRVLLYIHFAKSYLPNTGGQRSYGGKSPRGKSPRWQKSSGVNVRGGMSGGGGNVRGGGRRVNVQRAKVLELFYRYFRPHISSTSETPHQSQRLITLVQV